jgi:Fe(3+) dicitrate transport protein
MSRWSAIKGGPLALGLALAAAIELRSAPAWTQPAPDTDEARVPSSETQGAPTADSKSEGLSRAAKDEPAIEVRVAGTRPKETGGSVYVARKKQLERFAYDDPHQVLLSVPGVYVRGEDGMGLRPNIGMRGSSSDRSKKITLMEDGILFGPAPYSAPAAYYFPLIERMQQVRVVKGPAAIVYGPHTVGGALDLVTTEIPDVRRGTVNLAGGQFGYNKVHFTYGASDERSGFLVEGVRLANSGFKEIDGGGDTGFSRNEWMVKGRYVLDPRDDARQTLDLKVGYSDEDSNETYLGLTDADFRKTPYRRYSASRGDHMAWHRTAIQLSHKFEVDRRFSLTTTVYRHDLERVWRKVNRFDSTAVGEVLANPGRARNAILYGVLTGAVDATSAAETLYIGPNDRAFVSEGFQSIARLSTTTGPIEHKIEYGVRAHYDETRRKHTEDGFVRTTGELLPDGKPTQVTADNVASTHALAMYAVDAMTWGRLTVTPGIRVEAFHGRFDNALTKRVTGGTQRVLIPGVGTYYGLTDELGILGGVHKGFSPAPPGETADNRPEESTNFEAGARYTMRRLHAELIGFYNAYSNLTDLCTFSNGCLAQNLDRKFDAGRARVYGLEAFVEAEPKIAKELSLPLRASYTFTQANFLNSFVSADPQFGTVNEGDELPYIPKHQVSGSVGLEAPRWGANLSATYVDRMREIAGQGEPESGQVTDAYFLLDASASYRLFDRVKLYVHGRNLLDETYLVSRRPYGARPGAPRWILAGIRVDF